MRILVDEQISKEAVAEVVAKVNSKEMSKGAGIRTLFAGGLEVKDIATLTGIRYNHVYNVVKNEVLVHDLEVEKSGRNTENSKKNQIITLLQSGKSITEVAQELKCLYNYVWQVAKQANLTKPRTQEAIVITVPDDLVPEKTTKKTQKEAKVG
jgi:transposase-like protein